MRDGKAVEITKPRSSEAHAVHGDTIIGGIRDLTTGKVYDSKSAYLKNLAARGLHVVGNDLESSRNVRLEEKVTDDIILDRIERAEAIESDPDKRKEFEYHSRAALERYEAVRNKQVAFGIERIADRIRD